MNPSTVAVYHQTCDRLSIPVTGVRGDEAGEIAGPSVSVVICTRNRPDKIGAAVASVLANDHQSFELNIVDQSTDGATEEQVRAFADPRVNYVHSSEPGLSRAYNTGIRTSTAPIIAFTDDDCVVPTDWIRRMEEAFDSEPDGELLYGQVLPKSDDPVERSLTPALPLPTARRLGRKQGCESVGRGTIFPIGMGANFGARRQLFERIGGFDEVLGGGGPLRSSQDFDLVYRTYKGGSTILLRPEVKVLHDGMRKAEEWPKLLHDYGVGDGGFYFKHVRCGDVGAMVMLAGRVWRQAIRIAGRWLLRREPNEEYLLGMISGARKSFQFKVDRRRKLYAAQ